MMVIVFVQLGGKWNLNINRINENRNYEWGYFHRGCVVVTEYESCTVAFERDMWKLRKMTGPNYFMFMSEYSFRFVPNVIIL